jgi:hypothetical protein
LNDGVKQEIAGVGPECRMKGAVPEFRSIEGTEAKARMNK